VGQPDKHRIYNADSQIERIVAIADIHGDKEALKAVTQFAKVANVDGNWIGDKTVVVHTGDNFDRGPDVLEVFRYWLNLRKQARKVGGDVVLLLGNHEFMCLTDYWFMWRYVNQLDIAKFGGREQRSAVFAPDGEIGRELYQLQPTIQIGNAVFSHAGFTPTEAEKGVDGVNAEAREAMEKLRVNRNSLEAHKTLIDFQGSAWWTRAYEDLRQGDGKACVTAKNAINTLKVQYMVFGHNQNDDMVGVGRCGRSVPH